MTKRFTFLPTLLIAAIVAMFGSACGSSSSSSSDRESDMVGEIDISDPSAGADFGVAFSGPNARFRAQISDDGKTCSFWAEAIADSRDPFLRIQLSPNEIIPLLLGEPLVVTPEPEMIVQASDLYLNRAGDVWWPAGKPQGTLRIDPLPAPKGLVVIHFDAVRIINPKEVHFLSGKASFTYLGVVAIAKDGSRACPHLPAYPGGWVF